MMKPLLEQLKKRRLALGLKQKDMLLRIGVSRQQYQHLESKGNPRLNTLELIVKGLKSDRRAMLPHNILGLLSPTFIRLRSEWEMPWSPCVRLNYAQNPAPLRLPQMAGRLFGMQFLPPSRATSALRISELPCRL
ncbi:hypothetical protein BMR02_04835, partial [Methylococcaceae bacterium HT1]